MIILVPMGGKGSRFLNAGYRENKACIPTTDRRTGRQLPMVICAMQDLPGIESLDNTIVCIDRAFHQTDGTESLIHQYFPNTIFIHDSVLLDQAYACFLARDFLQTDEDLLIGSCDSGMLYDALALKKAQQASDILVFSHTYNYNILQNPLAHSWLRLSSDTEFEIDSISLKTPISDQPILDHATTGIFWFKSAKVFLEHLSQMIEKKDTLDGKYYVDQVLNYCISSGLRVQYFDVKYLCWGTPCDYENYEKTFHYWRNCLVDFEELMQ